MYFLINNEAWEILSENKKIISSEDAEISVRSKLAEDEEVTEEDTELELSTYPQLRVTYKIKRVSDGCEELIAFQNPILDFLEDPDGKGIEEVNIDFFIRKNMHDTADIPKNKCITLAMN
jgi:hypothetical protein